MASEIDVSSADAINKIDEAVDDLLKRLKNIENSNLSVKHYQLDLFRIYSEFYNLKSLLNARWQFWDNKIEKYKLNTDDIILKAYAQFENKIENLSYILNIKIDENIDYNKEYAEIFDINKYYDCINYILSDLKRDTFIAINTLSLDKIINIISEKSHHTIIQYISLNLTISQLKYIFSIIDTWISKHNNGAKPEENDLVNNIKNIAVPISLNKKIVACSALNDTRKKICDCLWQNPNISNNDIASAIKTTENTIKGELNEIYKRLMITGKKNEKRKKLRDYFEIENYLPNT